MQFRKRPFGGTTLALIMVGGLLVSLIAVGVVYAAIDGSSDTASGTDPDPCAAAFADAADLGPDANHDAMQRTLTSCASWNAWVISAYAYPEAFPPDARGFDGITQTWFACNGTQSGASAVCDEATTAGYLQVRADGTLGPPAPPA
jgi:hypothetical protein